MSNGCVERWQPRRGWRFRRIEPSPEFAQFLVGKLDSSEYARLLIQPRKTAGLKVQDRPVGPIARAHEEAAARNARMHRPTVTPRTAQVSLEYVRFLREEISSSDYAEALTDCAKLEGLYRTPAARFSFPKPGAWETLLGTLRLVLSAGGLVVAIFGLLAVLGPLGAKFAAFVLQWAWTTSFVGAVLLVVTLRNEASSLILNAANSLQRFVSERIAHQRA